MAPPSARKGHGAPAPRQPHPVGGLERRVPLLEEPLGVVERQILLKPLGRNPGPAAEDPLEMRRREVHLRRNVLQRQRTPVLGVDPVDRPAHELVVIACSSGASAFIGRIPRACPPKRYAESSVPRDPNVAASGPHRPPDAHQTNIPPALLLAEISSGGARGGQTAPLAWVARGSAPKPETHSGALAAAPPIHAQEHPAEPPPRPRGEAAPRPRRHPRPGSNSQAPASQ